MILSFFSKDGDDWVQVDQMRPMIQQGMGCRAMYEGADRWGGGTIMYSDKMIPTWAEGKWVGQYFQAHINGHGQIAHGFVDVKVAAAIGFKVNKSLLEGSGTQKLWWATKNNVHLLTADQFKACNALRGAQLDKHIAGLFPALATQQEAVEKGKAPAGKEQALQV